MASERSIQIPWLGIEVPKSSIRGNIIKAVNDIGYTLQRAEQIQVTNFLRGKTYLCFPTGSCAMVACH